MKRVFSMILVVLTIISSSITVFSANGDGNMDSGSGGGTGSGTRLNKWRDGDDGVRASIVEISTQKVVRTPIDFSNKDRSDIEYDFGKVSKIDYRNGAKLTLHRNSYRSITISPQMPKIINSSGQNDLKAIKRYFTSEWMVKRIAEESNIPYDEIVSGRYKLLIEPIVYLTYKGKRFAMTSHEAAMYNEKMNNDIVYKFQSITHRALPFAMFLEKLDLGFPSYTGARNKPQKDWVIKAQLGLGIVRFKEYVAPIPPKPPTPPKPNITVDKGNYDYRADTDVITSFKINSTTEIGNDNAITVTFHILGRDYTVNNIVIPSNSNQLVWVKWHTPKTPQSLNIGVSISNANISSTNIKANIHDLKEVTPPDPKPRDRNDNFRLPMIPNHGNNTSATWSKWICNWKPNKQYVVYGYDENGNELGMKIDKGYWEFSKINYSASLNANMDLVPGLRTPTAKKNGNEYEMKSGYGVNLKLNTDVSYNCTSNDITSAQNVITTFSEFKYDTYNRILEKTINNGFKSQFEFKKNKYSTYNDRTHFTPIWYPNQLNYIVNAEIIDVWTPVGMLRANLNDRILIDGNLHQDRHISIMK
ncbi:hypothetical protein PN294_13530 [Romboutsia sp. 1001216sp1]|uniref:hypothetical protein n=1 Tax=unclassified Romboutsia TaxID=2626894 RepID=UPI00189C9A14|nr:MULTISPECIES: hypothetical protein [unclassified Romboutsia]MDB8803205.1 hypothetical protein [Romboutsia sp. 1001216sp1]MDB8814564.1 hypothetical protein [Romboutsia sp. 1001216sp1]